MTLTEFLGIKEVALAAGWIERTQPGAPRSPTQRYRLTEKGAGLAVRIKISHREKL